MQVTSHKKNAALLDLIDNFQTPRVYSIRCRYWLIELTDAWLLATGEPN